MSQSVIADNWSLQNVSDLLRNGIDSETAQFVLADRGADSHTYVEIPSAVVAIEALFDLITDVVLRDQMLVDEAFADVWIGEGRPLNIWAKQAIVRPFAFQNDWERLAGPRNEFVDRLCFTDSLTSEHQKNVLGWEASRSTPNRFLSQVIWGGAGMLARAFVFEKGYTPHPARKRLIQKAGIAFPDTDAVVRASTVVTEKRAAIRAYQASGDQLYSLQVNMNPLPILAIREASKPSDIPNIALELRKEFAELRDWLGKYQESISSGNYLDIQKHQEVLSSISKYVDSRMGRFGADSNTYTIGIDLLKIAIKGSPANAIQNQFGVRAMINKLIVGASGSAELKKFLKFFGHHDSSVGLKVIEHFSSKDRR